MPPTPAPPHPELQPLSPQSGPIGTQGPPPQASPLPGTRFPLGQNRVHLLPSVSAAPPSQGHPQPWLRGAALRHRGARFQDPWEEQGNLAWGEEVLEVRGGFGGACLVGAQGGPARGCTQGGGQCAPGRTPEPGRRSGGPGSTGRGAGSCSGLPLFLPCLRPRWARRTVGLGGLTGVSCPLRPQTCRSPLPSCQAVLPAAWSDLHLFPGVSEEPESVGRAGGGRMGSEGGTSPLYHSLHPINLIMESDSHLQSHSLPAALGLPASLEAGSPA